jgi:hypothetical protein
VDGCRDGPVWLGDVEKASVCRLAALRTAIFSVFE